MGPVIDRSIKTHAPYLPPTPVQTVEREVTRLTPEVYAHLRRALGGNAQCFATQQTTEIQAGFMLGINHVLNLLQEGFVTTAPTS